MSFPLEPDRAAREQWLQRVGRFVNDHIEQLPDTPAVGAVGEEGLRIAEQVSRPIPETPLEGGIERTLEILAQAVGASLNTPGPGYLAYIPGGGIYAAALADLISDCVNRYTGLSAAAPALCRLEADVLSWLAAEFGYGPEARGVLLSGGSLANLSAIVVAREKHFGRSGDFRHATAYTSTEAHRSVSKAAALAGIPLDNIRELPVDGRYRLDTRALADSIRSDQQTGLRPFLVIAAAGTTNTGAIDPLDEVADLCADLDLWFHADAAYGGAFVLCKEGRRLLAGIERADSITFDPHKGMFLPYGTGCLLVKDGRHLKRAHQFDASYLQDFDKLDRSREAPSATDYGPELSRDYRGLRLWLPLMLHGAAAFREALAEKLELARQFHAGLKQLIADGADLEIIDEPQLSIVAFRLTRREHEPLESWNARNIDFQNRINSRKRVFLSSTVLPVADGPACTLRICVLSFRTHADRVNACLRDVHESIETRG